MKLAQKLAGTSAGEQPLRQGRINIAVLALLAALAWLGGCSDAPSDVCSTCPPSPQGLIVSDPAPAGGVAAPAGTASAPASGAGDSVAYVSLAPGTVPAGSWATLRRVGDAATVTDTVRDGGFDPVPVGARAGDSIEVMVRDAGGVTVYQVRAEVRAARPPVVVRTDPPRKKTDVPVNAALVVVFSEPVAGGTLTPSSVQLLRGESPVAGTVTLLQGTGAVAAFTPTAPLDRNADYRLVVTPGVRDLEGEALPAPVSVDFTTGQSSTGPAASITVSPDTVWLTGATYQLTATVRDAAGNQLIDQPVTWSTSDPAGLTVSATGLLTALAEGFYKVTATVDGLSAEAQVYVTAGPAASVTLSPTQAAVGASGDTTKLTATVRDAAGRLLDHPSVTWTSSDVALATIAADSSSSLGRAFATVTGVTQGSVTITATSATAGGTASVTVIPPPPVASVTVTPDSAWLLVQGRVQLSATVRDANGKALGGRAVTWTSDNAAVATVDATGLVTGISVGVAAVIATSEGLSDTAAVTVQPTVSAVLAFTVWTGSSDIWVTDGRLELNLTNTQGNTNGERAPMWSPDGQKIAFLYDLGTYPNEAVWVMNADGSAKTKLAETTIHYGMDGAPPVWSPDGQKIAFTTQPQRDGNVEIYVMNADGSAQINLTNNAAVDGGPAWSPDGQKIAFVSFRDGNAEIYVMNADGTAQTRLTNNDASDSRPVWSPDGQKIAFFREGVGIHVMNADGSAQTYLANGSYLSPYPDPVWSPDGQKIAFTTQRDGNFEIYVMNSDGGAQINLTNNAAYDVSPAWSPDGQKIAFVSDRDGSLRQIYVMNADGTTPIRITNNPGFDDHPLWRP